MTQVPETKPSDTKADQPKTHEPIKNEQKTTSTEETRTNVEAVLAATSHQSQKPNIEKLQPARELELVQKVITEPKHKKTATAVTSRVARVSKVIATAKQPPIDSLKFKNEPMIEKPKNIRRTTTPETVMRTPTVSKIDISGYIVDSAPKPEPRIQMLPKSKTEEEMPPQHLKLKADKIVAPVEEIKIKTIEPDVQIFEDADTSDPENRATSTAALEDIDLPDGPLIEPLFAEYMEWLNDVTDDEVRFNTNEWPYDLTQEPLDDLLEDEQIPFETNELDDEYSIPELNAVETSTDFVDIANADTVQQKPLVGPTEVYALIQPYAQFSDILKIEIPDNFSEAQVETIRTLEIPPLPQVCVEVLTVISDLAPEPSEVAQEMLVNITNSIDLVISLRQTNDENALIAEVGLENLCIELFTYLGIEYTPETMMEFVTGIMQTKRLAQAIAQTLPQELDTGTHEIKQDDDQKLAGLAKIFSFPTRSLGALILQFSNSFAA